MQPFKKILQRQGVRPELLNQGLCAAMVLVTVTVGFVIAHLERDLHGMPHRIHVKRAPIHPGGDFPLP